MRREVMQKYLSLSLDLLLEMGVTSWNSSLWMLNKIVVIAFGYLKVKQQYINMEEALQDMMLKKLVADIWVCM